MSETIEKIRAKTDRGANSLARGMVLLPGKSVTQIESDSGLPSVAYERAFRRLLFRG